MSRSESEPLLAPTFLFRFSSRCLPHAPIWSERGAALGEVHRLPNFGQLEGKRTFADIRAGWATSGLAISIRVEGKKQPPWCRGTRIEDSDGVHLFLDTRDTHNVHRAGRFCHHYALLPRGAGSRLDQPLAQFLPIARAREISRPAAATTVTVRTEQRVDGYLLEAFLPARALAGYDPVDHPRLGFTYAVVDRELGWQTYSVGPEFPIFEDPSLWGTLELVAT